jgi:hypothetical protein
MELHIEADSGPGFLLPQEKSPASEGGLCKVSLTKSDYRGFFSLTTITHPDLFCARDVRVARAADKPGFRSLVRYCRSETRLEWEALRQKSRVSFPGEAEFRKPHPNGIWMVRKSPTWPECF